MNWPLVTSEQQMQEISKL